MSIITRPRKEANFLSLIVATTRFRLSLVKKKKGEGREVNLSRLCVFLFSRSSRIVSKKFVVIRVDEN